MLWPISTDWIFVSNLSNRAAVSASMELILFVLVTLIMIINKDYKKMLFSKTNRIYWLIPLGVVLGSVLFDTTGYYVHLPSLLVVPSLFYTVLFSWALIKKRSRKI